MDAHASARNQNWPPCRATWHKINLMAAATGWDGATATEEAEMREGFFN